MGRKTEVRVSAGLKKLLGELMKPNFKKAKVWRLVVAHFTAAVTKNFAAQGRPRWKDLDPDYAAWKKGAYTATGRRAKGKTRKGASQILQLTQKLRKAAAGSRSHGFRKKEEALRLVLWLDSIPYAARHNYGYSGGSGRGRAPTVARPYWSDKDGEPMMTESEKEEMMRAVKARLVDYYYSLLAQGKL